MWFRLTIAAVTLFFITMNVLLWRSEIAGQRTVLIPPKVVWKRILENEHKTNFEIRHRGARIGHCVWTTTIQTEPLDYVDSEDLPVEGMAQKPLGYGIDFDGSFTLDPSLRLRFSSALTLSPELQWDQASLQLTLRPESWEVHASAPSNEVRFVMSDDRGQTERTFKLSDLRNPDKILRELAGPLFPELLHAMGLSFLSQQFQASAIGFSWEAWTDLLEMRNIQIPVYRLQGRYLDRVQVVVFVQRETGEIIRIELPNGVSLLHERLNDLLTQL